MSADGNIVRQSDKDDWETPIEVFQSIYEFVQPEVDVAAEAHNALLSPWYGPGSPHGITDSLAALDWKRPWFCNPPYSEKPQWVEKFIEQGGMTSSQGKFYRGAALMPNDTDAKWFHRLVPYCVPVFLKGRIPFSGKSGNTKGSILFIFDPFKNIVPNVFDFYLWDWRHESLKEAMSIYG